jgi:hypothetical protein
VSLDIIFFLLPAPAEMFPTLRSIFFPKYMTLSRFLILGGFGIPKASSCAFLLLQRLIKTTAAPIMANITSSTPRMNTYNQYRAINLSNIK